MIRPIIAWPALGFGVLLVLGCMGLAAPGQMVLLLGLGWVRYLIRVVPATTVNAGGVATALVCVALIAVLGHSFGRWVVEQVAPDRRWRKRWTAGLIGGVILMFGAGIAAAGLGHQMGWLLTSSEPWVQSSMNSLIWRIQSASHIRQIGVALLGYAKAHGSLPTAATADSAGRLLHGWQARILPYADNVALYNSLNFALPWDHPANAAAIRVRVGPYLNPGIRGRTPEAEPALSHYAGNAWVLGGDRAWKAAEITDALDQTILVGEAAGEFRPWADPRNWRDPKLGINRSPLGFGSPFAGGANFLFGDGSVRFLHNTTEPRVFEALCTPNGGEQVSADQY